MLECPSCQQALPLHAHFCTRCGERLSVIVLTLAHDDLSAEPYEREKRQLASSRIGMVESMISLLPFVYEDRRA